MARALVELARAIEREIANDRILTDRGTEYCGAHDRHEYELYLAVEDIDHTRTKVKSPQTNGICERFPQDPARRVLPRRLPQKSLRHSGSAAARRRCLDHRLQ